MYNGSVWEKGNASGDTVLSVNSQTGVVVLDADDISDAATTNKFYATSLFNTDFAASDLANLGTRSHTDLTDKGTNTHAQIDTHIGSTSNPHSVTKAQVLSGDLIVNADIDASAAIAYSKLALTNSIVNGDINASAAIAESKLALDYATATLNTNITNHTGNTSNPHSVTKAQVLSGDLIVNTDVDNAAAIAESKLNLDFATATLNTNITNHTGNTSNPHSVTKAQVLSGDLIVNADIDASAAIAYSKLNLSGSIVDGDISASATLIKHADVVTREVPTGAINGVNTAFTLASSPVAGTEHVYLNGILQNEGGSNDYTISGANITFNSAPLAGDVLLVSYVK
jgi:hypothetical protein